MILGVMKTAPSLVLAVLAAACSISSVRAQDPPTIDIALYAGLTFTGTAGDIATIEATTDLSDPNSWSIVDVVPLKVGPNQWFDAAAPAGGKRFYRATQVAGPSQPWGNLVFIKPGTFVMGSPGTGTDETPQTTVTLSKGFYMGKYEVTQALEDVSTATSGRRFTILIAAHLLLGTAINANADS